MRARAEFFDRTSIYIQGVLLPEEALLSFQVLGKVRIMQVYKDGERINVYTFKEGWLK